MSNPDLWDEIAQREDEERFCRTWSEAPASVRTWFRRFLDGAALSAQPSLDERAGKSLAALVPSRLRQAIKYGLEMPDARPARQTLVTEPTICEEA